MGVDYIEGGYPGANATDTELSPSRPNLKTAKFTAFGMTKRAGRSVSNDPGLQAHAAMLGRRNLPGREVVGLSGARRARHHERGKPRVRRPSRCAAIVETQREAMIDCEHFFDGYKGNRDYALASPRRLTRPARAGSCSAIPTAERCRMKSNASSPMSRKHVPGTHLGIHTHNDTENAVANTLDGGARRLPPDPGHAERPWRALRQRQSDVDHSDAAFEERIRRCV